MSFWQTIFIIVWGITSIFTFVKGFRESAKKNAFGLTPYLLPYGIFVWGDAVVFGIFWTFVSLVALVFQNWMLFLLTFSVFWVVRSLGETIYWFNQQFSNINRNPPEQYWFYKYFHNDSVWFIHQIVWQCVTVISILASIYLARIWFVS